MRFLEYFSSYALAVDQIERDKIDSNKHSGETISRISNVMLVYLHSAVSLIISNILEIN